MTKPEFRTLVGDREIVTTYEGQFGRMDWGRWSEDGQAIKAAEMKIAHDLRVKEARRSEPADDSLRRLRIAFADSPFNQGSPFVVHVCDSQAGVDHSAVVMVQDGNRVRAFLVFGGDPEFGFVPATVALNAERREPL